MVKNFSRNNFVSECIRESNRSFCCGRYVFDFTDNIWRRTTPRDYCFVKCDVELDNVNPNYLQEVNQLLDDIFPDPIVKKKFIDHITSAILGNKKDEFFVYFGPGSNGKSLVNYIIESVFGGYYVKMPIDILTTISNSELNLNHLKFSKIVVMQQDNKNTTFQGELLQKYININVKKARELYSEHIYFIPNHTTIVICNDPPIIPVDEDIPIAITIPFTTEFVNNPIGPNQKVLKEFDYDFIQKIKGSFLYLILDNCKKIK